MVSSPAVRRLPHDVLLYVVRHLSGIDAVNFGLVCKAWSQPAETAIWSHMTIKLQKHFGETPYILREGAFSIEELKEITSDMPPGDHATFVWNTPDHFARLAWQRRSTRLRELYESILASIYAHPERRSMVRRITMDSGGGLFAAALLSAVRTSLRVLTIGITPPPIDVRMIEGPLKANYASLWDSISQLTASTAQLSALAELHVDISGEVTKTTLGHLLNLAPNLSHLSVALLDDRGFGSDTSLSTICEPLATVRTLVLGCVTDPWCFELLELAEIIELCPDITELEIIHPREDPWPLSYTSDGECLAVDEDDFFVLLGRLPQLTDLTWHIEACRHYNGWFSPLAGDRFPHLENLYFDLSMDEWLSLEYGHFEQFVPSLPKLKSLSFFCHLSASDSEVSDSYAVSNASERIPREAVRRFEAAPRLSVITIMLHTPQRPRPMYHLTYLAINSIRQTDSDGPHLYLTRRIHKAPSDRDRHWKDGEIATGTSYLGHFVPIEVIERMAHIEHVDFFMERDVSVSTQAWSELEKYMESLK